MTDDAFFVSGPPVAEMHRWIDQAACRVACAEGRAESHWWFPEKGIPMTARWAVLICKECPVQQACLEWATKYEKDGIWGGQSARGRARVRKSELTIDVECIDCLRWFTRYRTSGRPMPRCEDCRIEHDRARKRKHDERERIKAPGSKPKTSIAEGGHGRISRYNDGCRCLACRRAARRSRARYERAS